MNINKEIDIIVIRQISVVLIRRHQNDRDFLFTMTDSVYMPFYCFFYKILEDNFNIDLINLKCIFALEKN